MLLKRNIVITIALCLLSVMLIFIGIPYAVFFAMKTVPLSELKWEKDPSVIALAPIVRDGKEGTLIIRFLDGNERFIEGRARIFHISENSLILVPRDIPQDYNGEVPFYYVEHGRKIFQLKFAYRFGNIVNVTENKNRTYLAIESYNGKSTQVCVIERIGDTKQPACQQLTISGQTQSLWNPEKDRELLIFTQTNEIITFDPWERRPHRVRADGDAEQYARLLSILQTPPPRQGAFEGGTLRQVFFSIIREAPQGRVVRFIPPFSRTYWLSDIEHVLVHIGNDLWILEYATGKKAKITLTPPDHNATIQ